MGKEKQKKQSDVGYWSFGRVNGRLVEFHFEINKGKFCMTYGHCYVKREEYETKQEQKWIDEDTKKYHFTFRDKKYRWIKDGTLVSVKHFRIPKRIGKAMSFEDFKKTL